MATVMRWSDSYDDADKNDIINKILIANFLKDQDLIPLYFNLFVYYIIKSDIEMRLQIAKLKWDIDLSLNVFKQFDQQIQNLIRVCFDVQNITDPIQKQRLQQQLTVKFLLKTLYLIQSDPISFTSTVMKFL